jgi:hypothetical protein
MRPLPILAALVAAAALAPAPTAGGAGLPDESPSRTLTCAKGGATIGSTPAGAQAGPLRMIGAGGAGSHWNPAARRFTSKIPIVVFGSRPVTVAVPKRLAGRLALAYGVQGLSRAITFVPCEGRRVSFFPGGVLFTRREPLALLVRAEGWARARPLRLGVIGPHRGLHRLVSHTYW